MAVTIRQIYEGIKDTEEIHLVAGTGGMDHVVRWVHMVESDDISTFLEGDEVVFTTGIALKSGGELYKLVELNHMQQAAGMVINVGPYIDHISKEIIDYGDAHDFPIFEVPWRVHMANIMRYCSTQINLDEQKQMELHTALKNAVYLSENEEFYVPPLMRLGYKKDWLYGIALLEFQQKAGIPVDIKIKKKITKMAESYFHSQKNQVVVLEEEGHITVFYANLSDEKIRDSIQELWIQIQKYLIPKGRMYAGMGRTTSHLQGIGKSYHMAEQVLELQKKRNASNQAILYRELGLYKLLIGMEDTELMKEYYKEHLGRLEKFDRMNETDYLYFLKQYFALGCSAGEVAAALHMHRNSITYKLHRIEEITGFCMADQETRTRFMVAFMIQELR